MTCLICALVLTLAWDHGEAHATTQTCEASYYGYELAGNLTANGEVFDPMGYTTASWSYPLNSYVRVTNLYNGHSVVLRVNDRGPAVWTGRCIDVSLAGASALGFTYAGHTLVSVELIY